MSNLKGKDLLSVSELSINSINSILTLAQTFKNNKKDSIKDKSYLKSKQAVLLFEKQSLRTRVSFEVAINQLGGNAIHLNADTTHINRGESLADTARVLSRYVDCIIYRAYKHTDIEEMAEFANIPVINALSDFAHPCQALTDIFTIFEFKKSKNKLKLSYIGDANNVANSLLLICPRFGIDVFMATPRGYEPSNEVLEKAKEYANTTKSVIEILDRPIKAMQNADIVYTDVWVSMGQEEEYIERMKAFKDFRITEKLMAMAKPDVIFMHDLPAHRELEVETAIIDGKHSVVFTQAENRLYVQKAILALLVGE